MKEAFEATTVRHARMVGLMKQLAPTEGYTQSRLEGVTFMRSNRPLASTQALYEPSIVIVVQGRKRGLYGGKLYIYDARHYLVVSVPLPFSIETEASAATPMLGLALRIDPTVAAELAMGTDAAHPQRASRPATMYATRMDAKLEDATLRLLEALGSPAETRVLGPSIVREITYRVLTGEQGGDLRAALFQGSHFGRIAKVLRRIHAQYDHRLDVATLAAEASMSISTFHTHFKTVTSTSPIQYIKAIRLHQARLMMIRKGMNAATVSERVGYESASQFSREFKRLFGRSPIDEARHLADVLSLASPMVHSQSPSWELIA